jgi:hypothetical protein
VYGGDVSEPARGSFEVAPTPVGGSGGGGRGGGRRHLSILLVAVLAVAVPAVAFAGPRVDFRPDFSYLLPNLATPTPIPTETRTPDRTPRPTPSPTPIPPSAPPPIMIFDGDEPSTPMPIFADTLKLVNPASGEVMVCCGPTAWENAVFTSPEGRGWWCVCISHDYQDSSDAASVSIQRFDEALAIMSTVPVTELSSVAPFPGMDAGIHVDLEISRDGRIAYLVTGVRDLSRWKITLDVINLADDSLTDHVVLGSFPAPALVSGESVAPSPGDSPPPGFDPGMQPYLNGPNLRLSPDGGTLLAWASLQNPTAATMNGEMRAWAVDLLAGGGSRLGRIDRPSAALKWQLTVCGWIDWFDATRLAAICWPDALFLDEPDSLPGSIFGRLIELDGTVASEVIVQDRAEASITDPLLDRESGTLALWDPSGHVFIRANLLTGDVMRNEIDVHAPTFEPQSPLRTPPAWETLASDFQSQTSGQLIAEPDGGLLAIGFVMTNQDSGDGGRRWVPPGSSGIWAFDGVAGTLIDHWEPAAAYQSIGISHDGRWVLAAGAPGGDTAGRPAPAWEASVTVYDIRDGRLAVRINELGIDTYIGLLNR